VDAVMMFRISIKLGLTASQSANAERDSCLASVYNQAMAVSQTLLGDKALADRIYGAAGQSEASDLSVQVACEMICDHYEFMLSHKDYLPNLRKPRGGKQEPADGSNKKSTESDQSSATSDQYATKSDAAAYKNYIIERIKASQHMYRYVVTRESMIGPNLLNLRNHEKDKIGHMKSVIYKQVTEEDRLLEVWWSDQNCYGQDNIRFDTLRSWFSAYNYGAYVAESRGVIVGVAGLWPVDEIQYKAIEEACGRMDENQITVSTGVQRGSGHKFWYLAGVQIAQPYRGQYQYQNGSRNLYIYNFLQFVFACLQKSHPGSDFTICAQAFTEDGKNLMRNLKWGAPGVSVGIPSPSASVAPSAERSELGPKPRAAGRRGRPPAPEPEAELAELAQGHSHERQESRKSLPFSEHRVDMHRTACRCPHSCAPKLIARRSQGFWRHFPRNADQELLHRGVAGPCTKRQFCHIGREHRGGGP